MDQATREFFAKQLLEPENQVCVDNGSANPQWASVWHGCYISLESSGVHRSLGVHISFVRSTTMDSWKPVQLKAMELGGNQKLKAFFRQHNIPDDMPITEKYHTRAADWYRRNLRALAEGSEPPDPLPEGTGHLPADSAPSRPPVAFARPGSCGLMSAGGALASDARHYGRGYHEGDTDTRDDPGVNRKPMESFGSSESRKMEGFGSNVAANRKAMEGFGSGGTISRKPMEGFGNGGPAPGKPMEGFGNGGPAPQRKPMEGFGNGGPAMASRKPMDGFGSEGLRSKGSRLDVFGGDARGATPREDGLFGGILGQEVQSKVSTGVWSAVGLVGSLASKAKSMAEVKVQQVQQENWMDTAFDAARQHLGAAVEAGKSTVSYVNENGSQAVLGKTAEALGTTARRSMSLVGSSADWFSEQISTLSYDNKTAEGLQAWSSGRMQGFGSDSMPASGPPPAEAASSTGPRLQYHFAPEPKVPPRSPPGKPHVDSPDDFVTVPGPVPAPVDERTVQEISPTPCVKKASLDIWNDDEWSSDQKVPTAAF